MSRQTPIDQSRTSLRERTPAAETPHHGIGERAGTSRRARVSSHAEAMEQYATARDAWLSAMRAANSGRSADMAALALAQEAYELAVAERDRWRGTGAVAIPIEPAEQRPIDAVVGQELAWRDVHQEERERQRHGRGLIGRLFGRRRG